MFITITRQTANGRSVAPLHIRKALMLHMCQILKGILNPSRIAKLLDLVSKAIGKIFSYLVIYF